MSFRQFFRILITTIVLTCLAGAALAVPPAPATRTIFLPIGDGENSSPMNVAWHPVFSQYYASSGGNPRFAAYVYDATGTLIHTQEPINIDVRAWNYNPHSGLMEVVSYNALAGGADKGLIEAQLDGAGLLTGGTATLLASMPGNISSQTMPAYNPANDKFYSRDSSNLVHVVDRFDGSFVSTISLDFAGSGLSAATSYAIGFVPGVDWLLVVDHTADTAVVFDLAGDYVGTFVLDVEVNSSYGMGFTNNQLFVYDQARDGWQGYDLGTEPPVELVPTEVPTLSIGGLSVLLAGILLLALFGLGLQHRSRL